MPRRLIDRVEYGADGLVTVEFRLEIGKGEWRLGQQHVFVEDELTALANGGNWGNAEIIAAGRFDGWTDEARQAGSLADPVKAL